MPQHVRVRLELEAGFGACLLYQLAKPQSRTARRALTLLIRAPSRGGVRSAEDFGQFFPSIVSFTWLGIRSEYRKAPTLGCNQTNSRKRPFRTRNIAFQIRTHAYQAGFNDFPNGVWRETNSRRRSHIARLGVGQEAGKDVGVQSPPGGRASQPPRPRMMHEVLFAKAAVKRSQGEHGPSIELLDEGVSRTVAWPRSTYP
jgi:hypothetical protein